MVTVLNSYLSKDEDKYGEKQNHHICSSKEELEVRLHRNCAMSLLFLLQQRKEYKQTDRPTQTNRQTDRQSDRPTDRYMFKDTRICKETHIYNVSHYMYPK